MGVVGAVVDAAIGWLVQSILGSLFTAQIEAWARDVGLADDVENLKSEMRNVEMVLAAAEGRRIENKPLAQSLLDLKGLLYDAEDVMDELDYYRLDQQIEQGDCCMNPDNSPASSSTPSVFQRACSTASQVHQIVSWASHSRKRKREEEPIHCTMLPNEIKLDISERIKRIVNGLDKLGNSVREVLRLEISSSIAMRNQNQYVARNTRLTTSVPIEDKVYGRDAERDKIIELLINGKSEDLQVLSIVGIGGVGKTTLARFVYGDQRINDHFDVQMWVCVSTNFDKVRITHEILEHVCPDRQQYGNITNFNVLQDILKKNLEKKRFLLVLDDLWEEKDRDGWKSLLAPLKYTRVLDDQILAFHNLRGINNLNIRNCPKLVSISSEGFSQLTSLESLSICNCPNLLKPPFTLDAASENSSSGNIPALPYLKHLYISSSSIAGGLLSKVLPHMCSLETLSLCDCPQIKWLSISQPTETEGSNSLASAVALSAEDQTLLKVPSNILCSLKQLTFSRCEDLEFYGGKGGFAGFTALEKLKIVDCPKLGALLVSGTKDDDSNMDVGLLPLSIEVLSLSHLPENLPSYFLTGLAYLKELTLRDSPHLKCVQLHSCKALTELEILECEQLDALEGLQFLTSLRSLKISSCQQLGALEGLQFLTSLRSMEIEMNPKLSAAWDQDHKKQEQEQGGNQVGILPLSIDKLKISNLTNNVQSRLLSGLPAITELYVGRSPELTSLQLGHCPTLTNLDICHCESLASLHLGHRTALTVLKIGDCESLASIEGFQFITNLWSFTVAAACSLPPWMELLLQQQGGSEVLSRLTNLEIGDASVLIMSLCQQLTSLKCLEFKGEGTNPMVSLTEEQERALQLLTSLQMLNFWSYPNLLLLPADLRSLASLEHLAIYSCPGISRLPEMAPSCRLDVSGCSEELSQRCKEWNEQRREMTNDKFVHY